MSEPPPNWNYGDAMPIGDRRPEELMYYHQALADSRARFPVGQQQRQSVDPFPVNPFIQMVPQEPPPSLPHGFDVNDYDLWPDN